MKRCAIWSRAARGVRFVWIMGADNLRSFHRWQRWRDIARLVPIAVVDRLGPSLYATAGTAGQALRAMPHPGDGGAGLPDRKPPAWVFLHGLKSPLSSTALRAARTPKCHRQLVSRNVARKMTCEGRLKPLTRSAYLSVRPRTRCRGD